VFFEEYNKLPEVHTIDYLIEDEYGIFKAINFDQAEFIEAKAGKVYDVIFTVEPPAVLIPGVLNRARAGATSRFSISQSKIYKKLESALREKKKQHKNLPFKDKIVFIDSETFPEFQMSLFQNDFLFEIEEVRKVCDRMAMQGIVCLIRRQYLEERPLIKVDFLYRDEHELVVKQLTELSFDVD